MKMLILSLGLLLGPVNPETNDYLPKQSLNHRELACLAQNIYHEARGESRLGQLAVAYTTLNRVKHPSFSNTICAVVFEKGQFSWTKDKRKRKQAIPQEYLELARLAISQHNRAKFNALFFHSTKIKPSWKRKRLARIGNHIFYT